MQGVTLSCKPAWFSARRHTETQYYLSSAKHLKSLSTGKKNPVYNGFWCIPQQLHLNSFKSFSWFISYATSPTQKCSSKSLSTGCYWNTSQSQTWAWGPPANHCWQGAQPPPAQPSVLQGPSHWLRTWREEPHPICGSLWKLSVHPAWCIYAGEAW